jgi:hypothetical protein
MAAAPSRGPKSVNEANSPGTVSLTETASLAPAVVIEIRVERAAQLFDTLDPFPFREKGLDPAAEKYIVDWARELGRDRIGRRSLSIGILVLAVCLIVARSIPPSPQASAFGWILRESVLILGWVANWRPLEIFLYDWWPLARRRDLYLRLAAARVELQPY